MSFMRFRDAQPGICRVSLRVPGLCPGLVGRRLLFVTDIHHGRWFSREAVSRLLARLAPLGADLVLLGGDLADDEPHERAVLAQLARLRAPLGAFCVPGNNDYEAFGGDYAPFRAMLKAANITLLVNERAELPVPGGRLVVSGLDDAKYGKPDARVLAFDKRPGDFHLLLAHSPWALSQVPDNPPALALCGHTHGGQWAIGRLTPYSLGYEWRQRRRGPLLVTGEHQVGHMKVVVSNGIGFSLLPIRMGAPGQVHLVELTNFPTPLDMSRGRAL